MFLAVQVAPLERAEPVQPTWNVKDSTLLKAFWSASGECCLYYFYFPCIFNKEVANHQGGAALRQRAKRLTPPLPWHLLGTEGASAKKSKRKRNKQKKNNRPMRPTKKQLFLARLHLLFAVGLVVGLGRRRILFGG
jgi:hypothetical protein